MKRISGEEIEIVLENMEGTEKVMRTKYPSLGAADPKEVLQCMSEMMNVGAQIAYVIGSCDAWIEADAQTPGTDDTVDVTVETKNGDRIVASARYRSGRWAGSAAKKGTITAWKPKPVPFNPDVYKSIVKRQGE